tara:strand:+ start:5611 stop:6114 length:504 start_codon:yes stop_codon:yes gene_type:complete
MGLIQVATSTVTSSTAQVILTGINTDDVYLFTWVGVTCSNDVDTNQIRITKSGTAQTDANYDWASKQLFAGTGFVNNAVVNSTTFYDLYQGTQTGEMQNGLMYLYNFNSSSEYSFVTREQVSLSYVPQLQGVMGGGVHTVASASDGIEYKMSVGTLTGGTFTLYKVV